MPISSVVRSPRKFFLLSTFAVGLVSSVAMAALTTKSGSLQFQAAGPGGLSINGDGAGVKVHEEGESYVFEARVDALKTGIELRDNHLKKYIEAEKFPVAKLVVAKSAIPHPADGASSEGTAQGQLTFHGQTKPISVPFKVSRTGSELTGQGRFEFDLPAFGVEAPCYLGVCVDKHVKVKAKLVVSE